MARQRPADRPRTFTGRLAASFGPDLHDRETTSALARSAGATAAINSGFFVLDPASGPRATRPAPACTTAGCCRRPSADRPALVLHDNARGTAVRRLTWDGTARIGGRSARPRRHQPGARPDPQLRRRPHRLADVAAAARHHLHRRQRAGGVHAASTAEPPRGPRARGRPRRHGVVTRRARQPAARRSRRDGRRSRRPARRRRCSPASQVGDRLPVRSRLDGRRPPRWPPRTARPSSTAARCWCGAAACGSPSAETGSSTPVTRASPTDGSSSATRARSPASTRQGRTVLVTVDGRSTEDLGLSHPRGGRRRPVAGPGRRDQPRRRRLHDDGRQRVGHLPPLRRHRRAARSVMPW